MLWSFAFTLGLVPLNTALSGNFITFLLILNYEWIHFLIHTSYVPKSWFYRRLWRNHRLHHFQNENFWFGLTMLSGDRLLGTLPSGNRAIHSQTASPLPSERVYLHRRRSNGRPRGRTVRNGCKASGSFLITCRVDVLVL